MKDFFDIWLVSRQFDFDANTLPGYDAVALPDAEHSDSIPSCWYQASMLTNSAVTSPHQSRYAQLPVPEVSKEAQAGACEAESGQRFEWQSLPGDLQVCIVDALLPSVAARFAASSRRANALSQNSGHWAALLLGPGQGPLPMSPRKAVGVHLREFCGPQGRDVAPGEKLYERIDGIAAAGRALDLNCLCLSCRTRDTRLDSNLVLCSRIVYRDDITGPEPILINGANLFF